MRKVNWREDIPKVCNSREIRRLRILEEQERKRRRRGEEEERKRRKEREEDLMLALKNDT